MASSILTTFLEASPASKLGFEKGVGVGPVTPFWLFFFLYPNEVPRSQVEHN
jgi:hypothetical protein